jgi:hypothetical protein
MTNEVWLDITPSLCKGICSVKGIRDHPNWWVVLSYDGYGSHLQNDTLEVFTAEKNLVMKEEGDISKISQAYDQMVVKSNKRFTRSFLDGYRFHTKVVINQFELILIINSAINSLNANSWQTSFINVKMCPSKHLPFTTWVKKHESLMA